MGRSGSKSPTVKELEKAKALYALGKSYNQVAKELERDPKSIKKWLTSSPEVVKEISELKREVATLYEDLAHRILESISDDTIEEAKLRDRVVSAGVATDKSRLLRGEATQHISCQTMHMDLNELIKQTQEIQREMNLIDAEIEAEEGKGEVKKIGHDFSGDEKKQ